MIKSVLNLTGLPAAHLSSRLLNFRVVRQLYRPNSKPGYIARSYYLFLKGSSCCKCQRLPLTLVHIAALLVHKQNYLQYVYSKFSKLYKFVWRILVKQTPVLLSFSVNGKTHSSKTMGMRIKYVVTKYLFM